MLAHTSSDLAPSWLLVGTLVVAVYLTWTGVRASWTAPRLEPNGGRLLPAATAPVLRVLGVAAAGAGLVVWALTLTAGLFADTPDLVDNLAPFVVNLQLLTIGMVVAAVFGDWWAAAGPFATLARLVPERAGAEHAPAWTAPVLMGTFLWLVACYHDNGDPVAIGAWLALYSLAVLVGAFVWGRWWASEGEGFAVLLGACARISPLRRDPATGRLGVRSPLGGLGASLPAGTAATCLLVASTSVFVVIRRTDWWVREVNGTRSGWDETMVSTVGLLFVTGVAAVVLGATTRRHTPAVAGLVPLAVGVAGAMLLTQGLSRTIDFAALLSDPYGRDWNLFGTADWFPPARWDTSRRLGWTECGVLLLGTVAGVVAAQDATLRQEKGRASAQRALIPQLAAGTLLAVAALLVLLG